LAIPVEVLVIALVVVIVSTVAAIVIALGVGPGTTIVVVVALVAVSALVSAADSWGIDAKISSGVRGLESASTTGSWYAEAAIAAIADDRDAA
jgi:hypothetical protein